MGRKVESFQPSDHEVLALRAAWQHMKENQALTRQFGPTDRVNREDFSALRKALTGLQKALVPFQSEADQPTANWSTLRAHWQGHALDRGELIGHDVIDARLGQLLEWLPDLVAACEPVTRGAGASVNPGAYAWILCSMAHWQRHTGKKPGIGPRSRYVQALLSLQDSEPWPHVTERMIRTAHADL